MAIDTREATELQQALQLKPGPRWGSFEQFRIGGVDGLREELGSNQVGRLNVKDQEFVIMHAQTFRRLYGITQEVVRLIHQLRLIRQAAQLVHDTAGSEVAVQHLSDLMAQLPELATHVPTRKTELIFDEDECAQPSDFAAGDLDFELDPARVRPSWTRG
jgi:hypothetical protein